MINIKEFNYRNNNLVIPYHSIVYPADTNNNLIGPHEIIGIFLEKVENNPTFVKPNGLLYCLYFAENGPITVTSSPCEYERDTKTIYQDFDIIYSTTFKNDVAAIDWFGKYRRSTITRNKYQVFDVVY